MRLSPRDAGFLAVALALVLDQGTKLFMLYRLGFALEPTGSHVIPVLPTVSRGASAALRLSCHVV